MKWSLPLTFGLFFAFILVASVKALDSGTIFSAKPGTGYKCIYLTLPQDLGIDTVSSEVETVIEVDKTISPWVETTYNKVILTPGVVNKNPICFSYSEKEEGDFSFYNIHISSVDLGISNSISGGLCISNYDDVDTGVDVNNKSDVCKLLSENADIIDLSLSPEPIIAKPGEVITATLYITSYANIKIKLSIATNLQNDFGEQVVTTSSSKPMVTKKFKIKAPEKEGTYTINIMAQVEGCEMKACKKNKEIILKVNENEKVGFTANLIPQNINLKTPGEVLFRVIIENQEKTQNFTIEVTSDPQLTITPKNKTITIEKGEEMTTIFSVIPGNEKLYKLEFRVSTENTEKLLTSYISIGEILRDALRYSNYVENEITPNLKDKLANKIVNYEETYNQTSYGEDIPETEEFLNTIDELKRTSKENTNHTPSSQSTQEPGFNWMFITIPVIIIVAIILLFIVFKKAKTTDTGVEYTHHILIPHTVNVNRSWTVNE
jgi:hypothetical protein